MCLNKFKFLSDQFVKKMNRENKKDIPRQDGGRGNIENKLYVRRTEDELRATRNRGMIYWMSRPRAVYSNLWTSPEPKPSTRPIGRKQ